MSTPAEIIAARVNGLLGSDNDLHDTNASFTEETRSHDSSEIGDIHDSFNTTVPSISDESFFPVLGGGKKFSIEVQSPTPSWGPSMKASVANTTPMRKSNSSSPSIKSSVVQEAFTLGVEDQINVAKHEFLKILASVKNETSTDIECTTSSHSKMRTFLITGKPEDVRRARRLILKKLTKPVQLSFTIPYRLRSKVIGAQGRMIRKITSECEVKIDVDSEEITSELSSDLDEFDLFSKLVQVTIEGDAQGCKEAKAQILKIVSDEAKILTCQIDIESFIKPFISTNFSVISDKYENVNFSVPEYNSPFSHIRISGDREEVLNARIEIKKLFEDLTKRISSVEVPIPKVKHQFLPVNDIFERHGVLIKLPEDSSSTVEFIGEAKKISAAQDDARKETSQYKVDVLDMGKAHKGNLDHVRALASLLRDNGTFASIAEKTQVAINVPSRQVFEEDKTSSIPIELIVRDSDLDKVKVAKKEIVSLVNSVKPEYTKVIDDIDSFYRDEVPQIISQLAKEKNLQYSVLGDRITLFAPLDDHESEDFESDFFDVPTEDFEAIDRALDPLREKAKKLRTAVLDVSAEDQTIINGPNGSTLRTIYSSFNPSAVKITLFASSQGPSKEHVLVRGNEEETLEVENIIREILEDAKAYSGTGGYKTSLEVPTSILSRLIGKNGAYMTSLREKFGVKIDVNRNSDNEIQSRPENTEIIISGIRRNAEECKAEISSIVKKWLDERIARLNIENQFHRKMIGPNGIYINRLQDKYNVKINFPNADKNLQYSDSPKSKNEVTIRGSSKNVAKAEEELKDLYNYEKEHGYKQTINIPVIAIARVVGKSGETIKDLTDECGVEYRFSRDDGKEAELGYTKLELTGSKSALNEACKKIQLIIDEAENYIVRTIHVNPKHYKDLIGPNGSTMKRIIAESGGDDVPRSKYYKLLSMPSEASGSDEIVSSGDKAIVDKIISRIEEIVSKREASITTEIDLPKEKHRLIVGSFGSIRHSIQDEFDVLLEIPRPNEESTIIKVTGLEANVEKAKAKIEEMTKDNWNASVDIPEVYHPLVSERGAIFKKLAKEYNVEISHGNLTRNASRLSNTPLPAAPEEAFPEDNERIKFTSAPYEPSGNQDSFIPWRIKGEDKDVKKAISEIEQRLENAKNATSVGWIYCSQPSNFFKVVGPQGSKINKIRSSTNTFITIPRSTEENPNFIVLIGTEKNLETAKETISKFL